MNLASPSSYWVTPVVSLKVVLLYVALTSLVLGCHTGLGPPTPLSSTGPATVDLDAEVARADSQGKPILLLVTEPGHSAADNSRLIRRCSKNITEHGIISIELDINVSRNRATALRFHITNTPVLFCLSPKGLIINRDEAPITKSLLFQRIEGIGAKATELDEKLGLLQGSVAQSSNATPAEFELANFFLAQQNAREAIPLLETVARTEAANTTLRISAWANLARAHLWVAEPEKGRHEAAALIAVLGPRSAEARAAGNYVLGIQDAAARRTARARQEFEIAINAAPDSPYAKQAAAALAMLPGEEN